MPTENRSTKQISPAAPGALAESIADVEAWLADDSDPGSVSIVQRESIDLVLYELKRLRLPSIEHCSDDAQVLTEQHAAFIRLDDDLMMSGAADFQDAAYALGLERGRAELPAQHQIEPVALPERKPSLNVSSQVGLGKVCGWNSCLAEVTKLGPLYTHPDAGEVERLRAGIRKHWRVVCNQRSRIIGLRADLATVKTARDAFAQNAIDLRVQLAEKDSVLKRQPSFINALEKFEADDGTFIRLGEALGAIAASAELSAPVERDEQTDIELAAQAIYETWSDKPGYVPWQAGGNSEKQGDARLLARRAAAKLSGE